MCITSLKVNMLGGLSIQSGGAEINDSDNRSRKVWLLLAYMIYCRKRPVTQEELVRLLWDDGDNVTNPANALKTMFHRVRTTLDRLGDSAGHILIVRQGGSYAWNCKVPLTLDVEEFDELCQAASDATRPKERLERYLKALELYNGDFLAHFSSDPWVVPVAAYYHNIYLQVVHEVLPMLEEADRREEAALLCRQAIQLDPYCEELYWHLMRNLLDLERQKEAIVVYEEVTQLLYDNFGVNPSDELRALYREAMSSVSDQPLPLQEIQERLTEADPDRGAMVCQFDFFRTLYQMQSRLVARSGDAVHIALISVQGEDNEPLPKRSLNRAMKNLLDQIRYSLHRGDVVAPCSVSQYILMLPQANYENSCMVCQRILLSFARRYPHSPAKLHYSVQPLIPLM